MIRVAVRTLGCKVNQYESEKLLEDFSALGCGIVESLDDADVYIVNTCTVTQTADSKSRQAVRNAIRRGRAIVVVTGCYAETSPEVFQQMQGVSLVIGNQGKQKIAAEVMRMLEREPLPASYAKVVSRPRYSRTRAFLKIQDGCNQFCSYCAVPLARSVVSSKPADEVLAETQSLVQAGHKEIVLVGIRLGRYDGHTAGLTGLIEMLARIPKLLRIRLSSIELMDITPSLLKLMSENSKLCPHLHIPLQSGDDGVLRRMNRPYTTENFAALVETLRKLVPRVAITTDMMVGFPGETVAEFEKSCEFVRRMRFARLHVFRYSARPGTTAALLPDDVSCCEKQRRSARLIQLGAACAQEFANSLVGQIVSVLVEGKTTTDGRMSGLTDNYMRVFFECAEQCEGEIIDVLVESAVDGALEGRPVNLKSTSRLT